MKLDAPLRASMSPSAERHVLVGAATGALLGIGIYFAHDDKEGSSVALLGPLSAVVGGGLGGAAVGFLVYIARRAVTGPSRAQIAR